MLPMSRSQWVLLILLVISIFINYIDRGNLSIAAPLLRKEIDITPQQMGMLLSSFFWTYAACQLFGIAGWLVNRFNVYVVYGIAFLLWSSATAVTGLVSGFTALLIFRLILGVGESLAYPVYSRILASDYEENHRGTANSLIDAGSKLGPAFGTLFGGILMKEYGWRVFFIALGVGSLLWLLPWVKNMPKVAKRDSTKDLGPTIAQILGKHEAWATFIGLFCANYFWYFLLTWLPSYLVDERHFSMGGMAQVGAVAYLAIATTTTFCGWLSDRLVSKGHSPMKVRRALTSIGLMGSTFLLPVAVVQDQNSAIALLMLACLSYGIFTSSHWAITQTLAGSTGAAKWTGLQNGIGNLAGVTAPWLTGYIVQRTGIYYLAFLVAAGIALTGSAVFFFWIGRCRAVDWSKPTAV